MIAVANHIDKTLGHIDSTIDDILKINNRVGGLLKKLSHDGIDKTLESLNHMFQYVDVSYFHHVVDQLTTIVYDWSLLANHKSITSCVYAALGRSS